MLGVFVWSAAAIQPLLLGKNPGENRTGSPWDSGWRWTEGMSCQAEFYVHIIHQWKFYFCHVRRHLTEYPIKIPAHCSFATQINIVGWLWFGKTPWFSHTKDQGSLWRFFKPTLVLRWENKKMQVCLTRIDGQCHNHQTCPETRQRVAMDRWRTNPWHL